MSVVEKDVKKDVSPPEYAVNEDAPYLAKKTVAVDLPEHALNPV